MSLFHKEVIENYKIGSQYDNIELTFEEVKQLYEELKEFFDPPKPISRYVPNHPDPLDPPPF